MFQRLRYHFRLGLPLIAFTAAVVFALSVGGLVLEIVSAPPVPSSWLAQQLGDGLDQYTALMSGSLDGLVAKVSQFGIWIAAVALIATTITMMSALRYLSRWVQGPSDAGALLRHIVDRGRHAVGISASPIVWGVVHDARTGQPLPLATVRLLDARGSVIASAVADTSGRYGFHTPVKKIVASHALAGVHVLKDGYFLANTVRPIPAITTPKFIDIPMEKSRGTTDIVAASSRTAVSLVRGIEGAAFWSGLVTVPFAYSAAPGIFGAALIALFAFATVIRSVGQVANRHR